jgi:predicted transcriptional regulator of viral defense system
LPLTGVAAQEPGASDQGIAVLAGRQHGLVTRPQLARVGIDDDGIRRRVRKGTLHRIHQGVHAVGHANLTTHARWAAAVLACGPGSALSHLDAARLWAIYDAAGPRVHVLAASNREVSGIWVHRARRLHPDHVTERDGVSVTTVARTLIDLTDILSQDRILRAIREAEFRRLLDYDALSASVGRARGRRNVKALTSALAHHRPGQIVRESSSTASTS